MSDLGELSPLDRLKKMVLREVEAWEDQTNLAMKVVFLNRCLGHRCRKLGFTINEVIDELIDADALVASHLTGKRSVARVVMSPSLYHWAKREFEPGFAVFLKDVEEYSALSASEARDRALLAVAEAAKFVGKKSPY